MRAIPNSFLGLEQGPRAYERARFVILPVPYDSTTSFLVGTRCGPGAIIAASPNLEEFDEELEIEAHDIGICTLDPVEQVVEGPEAMHVALFKHARKIVADGKFLFGLGGDHSITSALVRAVRTKHKRLSVLQIDAHLDLRDSYQGSGFSHACVMRRVLDSGADVVPVGIRAYSQEEHDLIKRRRIPLVSARDCHTTEDWVDRVLNALGETVYVTVDIDGFDPAYAPGTGTPEPGGLDWYQVTGLLRLVAAEKTIVGADIVEVCPVPGQVVTEFLAARLAYKLMGYIHTKA